MTEIKEITKEILEKLKPTSEYDKLIDETIQTIKDNIKKLNISATPTIGGSYAKNTHIGDSFDCDIFMRFQNLDNYKKELISILKPISKKLNSTLDLIHGSRDYFQIKYHKLTLEIIPVQYIDNPEQANHIMDYSPFHVTWVKEQLEKKPVQNDIRLMKQFLKANRIYGAESYISGFSGHVNDILVLFYGGFEKALKGISKWKTSEKTIIDYSNFYKNMDVTFFMNDSKTQSPLIAVDPIDKHRNAAAALGQKSYNKLIKKAKELIKDPDKHFFENETISKELINKKYPNNTIIKINILTKEGKTDIVGAKLVKALEFIERRLTEEGFNILETEWNWNKENDAQLYIVSKTEDIEKEFLRKGPSTDMTKAVTAFKEKNQNFEIIKKENILYVKLNRKYTNITNAIKQITKETFFLSKIQESSLE